MFVAAGCISPNGLATQIPSTTPTAPSTIIPNESQTNSSPSIIPTYPTFTPPSDFLTHTFLDFTYTEFDTYEELRAEHWRVWQYCFWLSQETSKLIMDLDFRSEEDQELWDFVDECTKKQQELLDLYNKYTDDIAEWLDTSSE